jgi:hypothetical protein
VISRPTTAQILQDCSAELLEEIIPAVEPGPAQVKLFMLEGVLRNAAMRASHEIAWMEEERKAAVAYATAVATSVGGPPGDAGLAAALNAAVPPASLHLDDVVTAYEHASEALSLAIEAAIALGDPALTAQGTALLEDRLRYEREILCGWGDLAGR